MDRNNVIQLITEIQTQDALGQYKSTETYTKVYCRIRSVSASEFFEGGRNGLNPQYQVIMSRYSYNGQQIVIFNGIRYAVYRVYMSDNDDVELYLQVEGGATHAV